MLDLPQVAYQSNKTLGLTMVFISSTFTLGVKRGCARLSGKTFRDELLKG